MDTDRCLRVAAHIHTLLTDAIGQGIEPHRMVDEPLYARDVLLVCDALTDSGGPKLASAFRHWAAVGAATASPAAASRPRRARPR